MGLLFGPLAHLLRTGIITPPYSARRINKRGRRRRHHLSPLRLGGEEDVRETPEMVPGSVD